MRRKLFQKITRPRLVSIVFVIAFIAITLISLRSIISANPIERWIFTIVYLPILPSFYLVITEKSKSPLIQYGVRAVSVIMYLILGLLLLGIMQDVIGVSCIGFFGVQENCLQHQTVLSIALFELWPPFMLLELGIFLALVIGLMDEAVKAIKLRR